MGTIISNDVIDICMSKVKHGVSIIWYVKKMGITYKLIARILKIMNNTLIMDEEINVVGIPHYPINITVHPVNEWQFIMVYRNFKEEEDPNKNHKFHTYVVLLTQTSENKIVATDPVLLKDDEGFDFKIENTENGDFDIYFSIQKTYTREKYIAHIELTKRNVIYIKSVELLEAV
jgi:hypothetical protein